MTYLLVFAAGYLVGIGSLVLFTGADCPACGPTDSPSPPSSTP